ncbi:MAG: hypothetical protein LAN64_00855 [Acidobacteriia bacterium]|nr:hypothetical protein [Terriglobia bacterium]
MRRKVLLTGLVIFAVLILTGTVQAAANKYGIADKRQVRFYDPVWVGSVLLPAGEYDVRHTMQGEEHVMVFRQMFAKTPAEAQVRCTLVPVIKPIEQDQVGFRSNSAGQLVLHRLAFKGDRAEHVF